MSRIDDDRFTFMWKTARDAVLFVSGILGVGYEAIFTLEPRIELLVLYGAMLGLPVFLRTNGGEK